jgi:MerR family mercuric resistance operon transcriptional regulator
MPGNTKARGRGLSRGQLAELTGCNAETIRYYEKIGVLPTAPRTAGGHRVYDDALVRRLAFVLRSRELGFSLGQVRELLGLADESHASCAVVKSMTLDHAATIRDKIADLRKMERILTDMAARCDAAGGGDVPACPIVDELFGPS